MVISHSRGRHLSNFCFLWLTMLRSNHLLLAREVAATACGHQRASGGRCQGNSHQVALPVGKGFMCEEDSCFSWVGSCFCVPNADSLLAICVCQKAYGRRDVALPMGEGPLLWKNRICQGYRLADLIHSDASFNQVVRLPLPFSRHHCARGRSFAKLAGCLAQKAGIFPKGELRYAGILQASNGLHLVAWWSCRAIHCKAAVCFGKTNCVCAFCRRFCVAKRELARAAIAFRA